MTVANTLQFRKPHRLAIRELLIRTEIMQRARFSEKQYGFSDSAAALDRRQTLGDLVVVAAQEDFSPIKVVFLCNGKTNS
jgi:hypothetical protein